MPTAYCTSSWIHQTAEACRLARSCGAARIRPKSSEGNLWQTKTSNKCIQNCICTHLFNLCSHIIMGAFYKILDFRMPCGVCTKYIQDVLTILQDSASSLRISLTWMRSAKRSLTALAFYWCALHPEDFGRYHQGVMATKGMYPRPWDFQKSKSHEPWDFQNQTMWLQHEVLEFDFCCDSNLFQVSATWNLSHLKR